MLFRSLEPIFTAEISDELTAPDAFTSNVPGFTVFAMLFLSRSLSDLSMPTDASAFCIHPLQSSRSSRCAEDALTRRNTIEGIAFKQTMEVHS